MMVVEEEETSQVMLTFQMQNLRERLRSIRIFQAGHVRGST